MQIGASHEYGAGVAFKAMDTELQEDQKSKRGSDGKTTLSNSKLERITRDASSRKGSAQERNPVRYVVRIISVRIRLLDEDNLCPKYAVDFLRYCGAIPSDAPGKCKVETTQRKVEKEEREHTEVRVWAIYE